MLNMSKFYHIIKKLRLTGKVLTYALFVLVGVLLHLLQGCSCDSTDKQRKTMHTQIATAINHDPDQHVTRLTITSTGDQELRIESILGVKTRTGIGLAGDSILRKATDLPDNGLMEPGKSIEILINDAELHGLDSIFVAFMDRSSQQLYRSPSIALFRLPPEPPKVTTTISRDPDYHGILVTIANPENRALRITSIVGIKKDRQTKVVIEDADDLLHLGIIRPRQSIKIPIDGKKLQDVDVLLLSYTDLSGRIYQSPSFGLFPKPPPEVATKDTIRGFYVFSPNIEIADSVRVIISKDIQGEFVLLDTILSEESPTLSIQKEWMDRGYYLRWKTKNSAWTGPISLSDASP